MPEPRDGNTPAGLRRAAARELAAAVLGDASPESVRLLVAAAPRLADPALGDGLLEALAERVDVTTVDEVWAVWLATRHPGLDRFLAERSLPATHPPGLRAWSALRLDRRDLLAESGAEAVDALLAAAQDADPALAQRSQAALSSLTNPAAQEEVCRRVIESDQPQARQAALAAGYAPRDPQRRALFFLLTEQWERYEALDFDARLLQAVYETAGEGLRRKIAELARKAGWAGFVTAVAGSRQPRRLDELTAVEWDVLLAMLGRSQRWAEIWQLAQAAPPLWSARLLHSLQSMGWAPEGAEEREGFARLAAAAGAALQAGPPAGQLLRYSTALESHRRLVTALVFSPDGALLVTGSADKTVRLWRLPDGEPLKTLEGHTNFVLSLALSPDGQLLASGGADKIVRLWRLPEGEPFKTLPAQTGEAASLAISPDGQLLASGDRGVVRIWQLSDGRLLKQLKARMGSVTALAFSLAYSGDGQLLAAQDDQKTVHWWRLPEGELLKGLMESAAAWAFTPDGRSLVSGSHYGRVRLWGLPDGDLLSTLPGRTDGNLLAVSPAVGPAGSRLACSDHNLVRLWALPADGAEPGEPLALEGHTRPVTALQFSPDGRLLASGSEDETVRLWQTEDGAGRHCLEGYRGAVRRLRFSPGGDLLAAADEAAVRLWALEDLDRLFRRSTAGLDRPALKWAEELRRSPEISAAQESWLAFSLALARWRLRHDIEIAEAPQHITVGEFDIEIVSVESVSHGA